MQIVRGKRRRRRTSGDGTAAAYAVQMRREKEQKRGKSFFFLPLPLFLLLGPRGKQARKGWRDKDPPTPSVPARKTHILSRLLPSPFPSSFYSFRLTTRQLPSSLPPGLARCKKKNLFFRPQPLLSPLRPLESPCSSPHCYTVDPGYIFPQGL